MGPVESGCIVGLAYDIYSLLFEKHGMGRLLEHYIVRETRGDISSSLM